jgi:hypothetical protein
MQSRSWYRHNDRQRPSQRELRVSEPFAFRNLGRSADGRVCLARPERIEQRWSCGDFGSAATGRRFDRWFDSSNRQRRVQRLGDRPRKDDPATGFKRRERASEQGRWHCHAHWLNRPKARSRLQVVPARGGASLSVTAPRRLPKAAPRRRTPKSSAHRTPPRAAPAGTDFGSALPAHKCFCNSDRRC